MDFAIKARHGGDVRMFEGCGFDELAAAISQKFSLGPGTFLLKYLDRDGDLITFKSQRELDLAVKVADMPLKVHVQSDQARPLATVTAMPVLHGEVTAEEGAPGLPTVESVNIADVTHVPGQAEALHRPWGRHGDEPDAGATASHWGHRDALGARGWSHGGGGPSGLNWGDRHEPSGWRGEGTWDVPASSLHHRRRHHNYHRHHHHHRRNCGHQPLPRARAVAGGCPWDVPPGKLPEHRQAPPRQACGHTSHGPSPRAGESKEAAEEHIQVEVVGGGGQAGGHRSPGGGQAPVKNRDRKARFVGHANLPLKAVVPCGSAFSKSWNVRNEAAEPWQEGCELVLIGGAGSDLESPEAVPVEGGLEPGQTREVTVPLKGPQQPGLYEAYFRMRTKDGDKFGSRLRVLVTVEQND